MSSTQNSAKRFGLFSGPAKFPLNSEDRGDEGSGGIVVQSIMSNGFICYMFSGPFIYILGVLIIYM